MAESPETDSFTPREFMEVLALGTGTEIRKEEYFEFLKKKGANTIAEVRAAIGKLTGHSPGELHRLAPETAFEHTRKAENIRKRIRASLINNLPFLKGKSSKEEREKELKKLSGKANDYIKEVTEQFFAKDRAVLQNIEVTVCDDMAELLAMTFSDRIDPKIKFEASRKLALIKLMGEIEDYSEAQVDHARALNFMISFFNRRIHDLPEGAKIGAIFPRFLISRHSEKDFRTVSAEFSETEPEIKEKNTKTTYLPSRRTVVTDEKGDERIIYFSMEPRHKTPHSRLTKTFRYNSRIGEKDLDRNGIRMVFETHKDWLDFSKKFQDELKNDIKEGLIEQLENEKNKEKRNVLESRLRNIDSSIIIYETKDSLQGQEFEGSANSSASSLRIMKFRMALTLADGRQHQYEFQIFLPDGYADATYRKGLSWEEYNVDRFFDEKVDELLFPPRIYPHINREEIHKKMLKQAHQRVWNGHAH